MSFQAGTRWVPTAAGGMTLQTADGTAIVTITSSGAITSSGLTSTIPLQDSAGSTVQVVPRVVRVVGPASYATGGFQVDCSAFFSSIVAAQFLRVFVTATGAGYVAAPATVAEGAPNVFSSAKFAAIVYLGASHTHTYDKTNTPTGTPSGNPTGFGADDAHTHTLTYTSTASGSQSTAFFSQISAGTNLSSQTYEFLVWGVPV